MAKAIFAAIMLLVFAFVGVCNAANWQTVTTFTGNLTATTDNFHVPTDEWRVSWTITPQPHSPENSSYLFVVVYSADDEMGEGIHGIQTMKPNGTEYFHDGSADYYLKLVPKNLQNYEITVEYDTTAVPEYSTATVVTALTLVSLFIIAFRGKLKNSG